MNPKEYPQVVFILGMHESILGGVECTTALELIQHCIAKETYPSPMDLGK